MTDPTDETKPNDTGSTRPTFDGATASDGSARAGTWPAGAPPVGTPPDAGEAADLDAPTTPAAGLRADPDRPADSGWREPAWFPPRDKDRRPNIVALIFGLVLIGIGLYAFLDRTLGVSLPRIQWSTLWPILLIGLGSIVLLRSVRRRS